MINHFILIENLGATFEEVNLNGQIQSMSSDFSLSVGVHAS